MNQKQIFTLLTAFLFIISILSGQTVSGLVLDSQTGKPIDAANVFFVNTTYGTLSAADGSFSLTAPMGKSELIISHISYKMAKRPLVFTKVENKERTIRLSPSAQELATITVSSKQDKRWRKDLKKFEKIFFGLSKNAGQCKILNPTVLQFEKKDGAFKAIANDILQIENKALGYKVYFLLEHFESKGENLTYAGKPYFEELVSESEKEKELWKKKRVIAYSGSLPHFLHSMINDQLKEEGFEVRRAKLNNNKIFEVDGLVRPSKVMADGKKPSEKILAFDAFLQVTYTGESDNIVSHDRGLGREAQTLGRRAEKDMIEQDNSMSKGSRKSQVSYLFARKAGIPIDTSGYLNRPELLVEYGYWNTERIADLVPRNFRNSSPVEVKEELEENAPDPILGFDMQGLRIPYEEIKKGGPPKDGIPSIDRPVFVNVEEAKSFLNKNDYVLGVAIDGIAKAYPIRILNLHEIVNDSFGKEPVVITYCPLCASGAAFSAKLNGERLTFGVSGLLYNSDVLFYDRETQSLWSQIMGEAVSGPASSSELKLLNTSHSTFEEWKRQYPETLVLSTDTGFDKKYSSNPYERYEQSDKLMFPVNKESKVLDRKEKVIGLEVDGKFKAYSFSKLKKTKGPVKDQLNGKEVFVHFNKASKSARITDSSGKELPSITLYWFAWYAFHPETEVY